MNVEMLFFVLLVIIALLSLVLLVWLSYGSYLKRSAANRRANELLRSVLTREQYRQLMWHGYLDIPRPVIQSAFTVCHDRKGWWE
jgi:Tfp pilus assembly protein PilE